MKRLKKWIIGMIGLMAVCTGIAGCGENKESKNKEPKNKEPKSKIEVKNRDIKKAKNKKKKPTIKTGSTIEETLLLDKDGIKITAKELTYTGNVPKLKLIFENNRDKEVSIYSGTMGYNVNSINGYMFQGLYVNTDVMPGNKATEVVSINYKMLLARGIKEIGNIQMGFQVSEADGDDLFTTGPIDINTSAYKNIDLLKDGFKEIVKDKEFMEENGITIDYIAEENVYNDGGVTIDTVVFGINKEKNRVLCIEGYNNGESNFEIVISDIEINGIVVYKSNWTIESINPKKYAIADININDAINYAGAKIPLEDISTITFKVSLKDEEGENVASEEEITITVSEKKGKGEN